MDEMMAVALKRSGTVSPCTLNGLANQLFSERSHVILSAQFGARVSHFQHIVSIYVIRRGTTPQSGR